MIKLMKLPIVRKYPLFCVLMNLLYTHKNEQWQQ